MEVACTETCSTLAISVSLSWILVYNGIIFYQEYIKTAQPCKEIKDTNLLKNISKYGCMHILTHTHRCTYTQAAWLPQISTIVRSKMGCWEKHF